MILALSCKKQPDVAIPPFLDIKFDGLPLSNVEPLSQDSVFVQYFSSVLPVHIFEYNIQPFKMKNVDNEIFAFQVTTPEDSEVFIKGKNIGVSGGAGYENNHVSQIDFKFDIRVWQGNRVLHNNDTVEYRNNTDYIKVQYKSAFSGRIVKKILVRK
jgi:hypothetical protein